MADVDLVFNEGNSVPNASSATDTLVEAASRSNFSLTVNTSSISATGMSDLITFGNCYQTQYYLIDQNSIVIFCALNVT